MYPVAPASFILMVECISGNPSFWLLIRASYALRVRKTAKFSGAKIRLPLIGSHRSSLGSIPATLSVPFCFPTNTLELFLEVLEVFIGEPFKINKLVSSAFNGTYDLVEFQINGFRVTVLRVLDEEHHEEGDDGRAGIDNELPGIGKVKCRASQPPNGNDDDRQRESPCAA